MADKSFTEMQSQMNNQMQQQKESENLKESSKSMAQAASKLSQTNQNQLMQMQMQAQAQQQQSQSLQMAAMSMQSQSNGGARSAPLAAPRPHVQPPNMGIASMVTGYASNRAEEVRLQASNAYQMMRHAPGAQVGMQPGYLGVQNNGLLTSTIHGSGLTYNPAEAQNYTMGAYQRAHSRNAGNTAAGYAQGAMTSAAGLVSFGTAGSIAGGMAGTALGGAAGLAVGGPIGGMVGGAVGGWLGSTAGQAMAAPLDAINPIAFGINEVGRANAFGANAEHSAHKFLRGAGQGNTRGSFSFDQQSRIGIDMAKMTRKDLTYTNEDTLGLQQQFADTGQFLGVQTAQQYTGRMRKMLDTHKTIMKTLQTSSAEAVQLMDEMFSGIGVDHGPEMTRMATKMYSAAAVAGVSPQQMAQMASQGAQAAGQFGMMAPTGARMMMQSAAAAGMGATSTVNTALLASVGGEQGLTSLMNRGTGQFMSGAGGSLMALLQGRGGTSTNVTGDMTRATGAIQGNGDMINLLVNKHRMMDDMSPESMQLGEVKQLVGLAEQMGGGAGTLEQRMRMILQGQGKSSIEADAMLQTYRAMPESIRSQRLQTQQGRADMMRDRISEQKGITNRMRLGAREFLGDMGGDYVMEGISSTSAGIGQRFENYSEGASDFIGGVGERRRFSSGGTERILKGLGDVNSGGAGGNFDARAARRTKLALAGTGGDVLKSYIKRGMAEGSPEALRKAFNAIKSGDNIGVASDITFTNEAGPVSNEEIFTMMHEVGATTKDLEAVAKRMGLSSPPVKGKPKSYMNQDKRTELARDMFGLTDGDAKGSDIDYAVSSKEFQQFMKMLDATFRKFDPGKHRGAQDDGYIDMEDKVVSYYQGIKDETVKKVIDAALRKRGISIGSDGVNFTGAVSQLMSEQGIGSDLEAGKVKGSSLFYSQKGGGMNHLMNKINESKDQEHVMTGIETTLSGLGVTFGMDASKDLNRQLGHAVDALGNADISPKALDRMMKSQSASQRIIGSAIAKQKRGDTLSQDERDAVSKALVYDGASVAEGTNFTGAKGLDSEVLGSNLSETANTLRETAKIQSELLTLIRRIK